MDILLNILKSSEYRCHLGTTSWVYYSGSVDLLTCHVVISHGTHAQ